MINRLQFSINIKADKTKIWKALWDDKYYRDWGGGFYEGSDFVPLLMEIDVLEEHAEFLSAKFPIALETIKKNGS